jgi:hypothetical protein
VQQDRALGRIDAEQGDGVTGRQRMPDTEVHGQARERGLLEVGEWAARCGTLACWPMHSGFGRGTSFVFPREATPRGGRPCAAQPAPWSCAAPGRHASWGRLGSNVGLASDTVALASSPVVASYGGLVRRNPHASFCRDPRSASPSTTAR